MAKISMSLSSKVNKHTGKAEILLRFIGGYKLVIRAKSGIFIDPKMWNDKKNELKSATIGKEQVAIQEKLDKLCNVITKAFTDAYKSDVTKAWLDEVIDKHHYPEKYKQAEKKDYTLFEWVEHFISIAPERKDAKTGRTLVKNNIQQYKATHKHLRAFAEADKKADYKFSEVNQDFYAKFINYLQGLQFTANSVGKHIRILKLMLNEAPKALKLQAEYSEFKVFTEDVDNVYLDKSELRAMKELDLSETPHLDRVRDWFLLLAWTGSRFSDLEKITKRNIKDGFLSFRQQKTNNKVTIPLHLVVVDVLEKYNYEMPEAISNQRFNEWIKIVAERAGITQMESITRTVAQELKTTLHPKYELISSHTGRRSFATNMYKDDFPSLMIMSITGHKTEKSFLKYIKISQEEHAIAMGKKWNDQLKVEID